MALETSRIMAAVYAHIVSEMKPKINKKQCRFLAIPQGKDHHSNHSPAARFRVLIGVLVANNCLEHTLWEHSDEHSRLVPVVLSRTTHASRGIHHVPTSILSLLSTWNHSGDSQCGSDNIWCESQWKIRFRISFTSPTLSKKTITNIWFSKRIKRKKFA